MADKICEEIPKIFDDFPNLKEITALIRELTPVNAPRMPKSEPWISKRCPGIHAVLEAICENFERNRGDMPHVQKLISYSGYSEEELWMIYDDWFVGTLHPLCLEYEERKRPSLVQALWPKSDPHPQV